MGVINIDYYESGFSYTEDYKKWKSIVGREKDIFFPKFLKKYKLKFMTAPTTSYYDTFILAKSKKCSMEEMEDIIRENYDNIIIYTIQKNNENYIFRFGRIESDYLMLHMNNNVKEVVDGDNNYLLATVKVQEKIQSTIGKLFDNEDVIVETRDGYVDVYLRDKNYER